MRCVDRRLLAIAVSLLVVPALLPAQALTRVQHGRYAMGTMFHVIVYHPSDAAATRAVDEALAEVVRLDDVMSHYKTESDLSRLNREGRHGFVQVPAVLYEVIGEALRFSRESKGAFDVSIGPLLRLWRDAHVAGRMPSPHEIARTRACVGHEAIEMAPPARIRLRSGCAELDLGGIGKGYAVDRAMAVLASAGIEHALVNAGGSTMAAAGTPPGRAGWPVALPGRVAGRGTLLLRDRAIATSQQRLRRLPFRDGTFGEIIDPERGAPLEHPTTVTVVTVRATDADALSTTLLLMGPDTGGALLDRFPPASALWMAPRGELQAAVGLSRLRLAHDEPAN